MNNSYFAITKKNNNFVLNMTAHASHCTAHPSGLRVFNNEQNIRFGFRNFAKKIIDTT